jgi:serine protease AprX
MKLIRTAYICLLLFNCSNLFSQQQMLIFFKDKNVSNFEKVSEQFSPRALQRRAKNNVSFSEKDLAVSQEYVRELSQNGKVLNQSRWLNAVSFETNFSETELMAQFDFIRSIQVIRKSANHNETKNELLLPKMLNYGEADTQIRQINLDCMHDYEFLGNNVYIGILDGGYNRLDSIAYFDTLFAENRILDTYNFLNNTSNVFQNSQHGTAVVSCIVAEKGAPNEYIGAAVNVDLALYISEDVGSETLIEEFNLVAALERCDSVGVDIANISLGYFDFDDSLTNHTYEEMDGETTIAAIGVNNAFSVGILVVVSAGNAGPNYIATPADADGALCVGAVNNIGDLAPFSSVGPSFDGQIKPDVVATGWDTWLIVENGDLIKASGTSFSSPIIAGAAACLMQAHPLKTASEIRLAIRLSGSQFATPDSLMGYGIPDFCLAHEFLSLLSVEELENSSEIKLFPNPASHEVTIFLDEKWTHGEMIDIKVYDLAGSLMLEQKIQLIANSYNLSIQELSSGSYILEVQNQALIKKARLQVVK